MFSLVLLVAQIATPSAYAFCGTYVGDASQPIYNSKSEVAIARKGNQTTLTLGNDYSGQLSDFALLIPVPEVLSEDSVRTVVPELLADVDRYSGPRLVSYTCEDFYEGVETPAFGCAQDYALATDDVWDSASLDDTSGVDVEASFTAGEYQIVILSAEDSGNLLTWLQNNDYTVSVEAEALLQEYIDGGSYFLAAKVSFADLPDGQEFLSPLQITYTSDIFSLPVRLGTVNSPGEQDLILYVLSDYEQGRIGISNYPEKDAPTDCMLREDFTDDFGEYYTEMFSDVVEDSERAAWVAEYGWAPYHCDPCVDGEALSDWTVQNLGYADGSASAYFTRIHMQYRPDQVDEDLILYQTGLTESIQQRYVSWNEDLVDRFEICGEGWLTDQLEEGEDGLCANTFRELRREDRRDNRGCASNLDLPSGSFLLGASLMALVFASTRRKA